MEGLEKLKAGDFNSVSWDWQPDGTVIVTMAKRGEDTVCRFRVRGLYSDEEQLLDLETGEPLTEETS